MNLSVPLLQKIYNIFSTYSFSDWKMYFTEDYNGEPLSGECFTPVSDKWKSKGIGHYFFRTDFIVPGEFNGLALDGSKFFLRFFITAPVKIYINGKKIYDEAYWSESQIPEAVICEHGICGEKYEIVVHVENTPLFDSMGDDVKVSVASEAIDQLLFETELMDSELLFLSHFGELKEKLAKSRNALESGIRDSITASDVQEAYKNARALMEGAEGFTKTHTVHMVGHAHIDLNWLWPMDETIRICGRDFNTITRLLEKYPDFHFSQSQAALYEVTRKQYPEIYEKIKVLNKKGQFEVTACTWSEADLNMTGGESIAHHLVLSRDLTKSDFGKRPSICWEPDSFGHPASMPKILNKSGIKSYYHYRCGNGNPLYIWEGDDGSKVYAFNSIYLNPILPGEIADVSMKVSKDSGVLDTVFVYGVGDHGGGPTERNIRNIYRMMESPAMPSICFNTIEGFFEAVDRQDTSRLPVIKGDLNPVFTGCYTTHADIKELNRACERSFMSEETAAALKYILTGEKTVTKELTERWKSLLFNQFHDTLAGSAINQTYKDACSELNAALEKSNREIGTLLKSLSVYLTKKDDGKKAICIWNFTGVDISDIVSLPHCATAIPGIADDCGKQIDVQLYDGSLHFMAAVPAYSARVYEVSNECHDLINQAQDMKLDIKEDSSSFSINTDHYEIEVSKESGIIRKLTGANGLKYIEPVLWRDMEYNYNNNQFMISEELPHNMPAWVIGPISNIRYLIKGADVTLKANGPLFCVLEVKHTYGDSKITQNIFIYKTLEKITFENYVVWNETANHEKSGPMLQVCFRPELKGTPKTLQSIPFGHIERPVNGQEYPMLDWADIADENMGFLITSDYKHGIKVSGTTAAITLIRSTYGTDDNPDKGEHKFSFSLHPHGANSTPGDFHRFAAGDNNPILPVLMENSSGKSESSPLPLKVQGEGVIISCLKAAYNREGIIVRLLETKGEKTAVALQLSDSCKVSSVKEISIDEQEILSDIKLSGNGFNDILAPFEVKTYIIAV